jgi:hypothetical protein
MEYAMKVGDLVKPIDPEPFKLNGARLQTTLAERDWKGIIIAWEGCEPVVFWNDQFPYEIEYASQLEVVSES